VNDHEGLYSIEYFAHTTVPRQPTFKIFDNKTEEANLENRNRDVVASISVLEK
jgi:hypothetical protein